MLLFFFTCVRCLKDGKKSETCTQKSLILKGVIESSGYSTAAAKYSIQQCENYSISCIQDASQKFYNMPLHILLDSGPKKFCQAKHKKNYNSKRSNRCNWCLSSVALIKLWKNKMTDEKFIDYTKDYCKTCGRYHQGKGCNQIFREIKKSSHFDDNKICQELAMCPNFVF
ncbi:hypothetical protein TRFO_31062 [Tritrichomonas foetus]|uniref:Uncharacterized protein n=1 Tax=Tritrichomonas foetus TaxID=1144522 RepID=A0A1J4JXH5_9EUKA|nr:hypothetical protein TRFO_31062 [Tritrichomonas foetus]|eukprot:OHT01981.1 hypothetical protein TRFO_31062 [Tritrichomonas foetus]